MKMYFSILTTIFWALPLMALINANCSSDPLQKSRTNPGKNAPKPDPFPIGENWTGSFVLSRTYQPTFDTNEIQQMLREKQASGFMCLKVTSIDDNQTADYKDLNETLVQANFRVVGSAASNDLIVTELDNQGLLMTPDPSRVDQATSPLWLANFTFPSSGHGYGDAQGKALAFHTRYPPILPNQGPTYVPFFDSRTDQTWGGWTSLQDNFGLRFMTYFSEHFGEADGFHVRRRLSSPANCSDAKDLASCSNQGCMWDASANSYQGACVPLYTMSVIWRETLDTNNAVLEELWAAITAQGAAAGSVVHGLRLDFDGQGVLRSWEEIIVPDVSPTQDLPNEITSCVYNYPCMLGRLSHDMRDWNQQVCSF